MPKKTIFLSYTHADHEIADKIDSALQNIGYKVKRDIRDIKQWGNLKDFMKTIRKEDYVVFLVSDTYLHRENCLFEVMQFLKDESYEKRALPIAIDFTSEEKNQRSDAGRSDHMFSAEYISEIIIFWQGKAEEINNAIKPIFAENRAELDGMYREIRNMAQTASKFLTKLFRYKLLTIIDPENPQYEESIVKIDDKINQAANDY